MNSEHLQRVERIHQSTAQAILRMRELIQYQEDFTEAKRAGMESEVNALLGVAQIQMDGLPDYRQFGQGLE